MLPSSLRMKRLARPLFVMAALLACTASAQAANLTGTAGNDSLQGGAYSDRLIALDGQDFADGAGGSDVIDAGTGDDVVSQGLGTSTDYVECGAGYDVAYYDSLNPVPLRNCELIVDLRWAAGGGITMPRTPLAGTAASDWLTAPWATQSIVVGAAGADKLWGSSKGDFLIGGAGNDFIGTSANTTTTPDRIFSGDGDDAITANSAKSVVDCGNGADTVYVTVATSVTRANCEKRIASAFTGTMGRDLIQSNTPATLPSYGFAGSDIMRVNAWDVYGGTGDDVMFGSHMGDRRQIVDCGPGEDIYMLNHHFDSEPVNCEITVWVSAPDNTQACFDANGLNPNNIVRGTDADDSLNAVTALCAGNGKNGSIITGGDGNDRLVGSERYDVLVGGAGNDNIVSGGSVISSMRYDSIWGGPGNDTITLALGSVSVDCGAGTDTVYLNTPRDSVYGTANCENVIVVK